MDTFRQIVVSGTHVCFTEQVESGMVQMDRRQRCWKLQTEDKKRAARLHDVVARTS